VERVRAAAALLTVAGVVVVAATVGSDGASGLAGARASTEVRAATTALPDRLAQEPRVAFAVDGDRLAEVGMTFELETGEGTSLAGVSFGEPRTVESAPTVEHPHEGESTSAAVDGAGPSRGYAFVGAGDDPGTADVRVRLLPDGAEDDLPEDEWDVVRVTCDGARETHPVLSSDRTRVAYATDASGDWEVVVAPVEECAGDDAVAPAPGPGADDLWPSWGPFDESLFFSSTRDDPLGDIYAVRLTDGPSPSPAPTGPTEPAPDVVRLTDDPGADTQPVLADTPYARTRVLFTTTRYDPAGSLATFALPDAWGWGYSVVSEVVEVGADLPGPVVGEASVRQVELDGGGVGLLVAYTARDGGTGLPGLWVAFVRVWVEQVDDDGDGYPDREVHGTGLAGVWRVPADGGASHPDWVTVTEPAPDGEPGPSPEPSPTAGPGPGGAVLRFTQRTGHRAVADAVVGGDGTVRRLGGADRTDDSGPAWSPDGTRLAFAAELPQEPTEGMLVREVATLRPGVDDGPRPLVPGDTTFGIANPDWSPDAARVAFSGYVFEQESPGVWWAETGSGATGSATDETGYLLDARNPSWSPDGARVVAEVPPPDSEDDVGPPALAVLEVATGRWTPLTVDRVEDCYREVDEDTCRTETVPLRGRDPAWSPDGTRIAVTDLRVMNAVTGTGGTERAVAPLYLPVDVAPGGIGLLELAAAPAQEPGPTPSGEPGPTVTLAASASASASAARLTGPVRVTGVRAVTGFDASGEVLTEQPEVVGPSAEPTQEPGDGPVLTPSRTVVALSDGPAWSPDGTQIVFSGQRAGVPDDRDVYAVAPDGTGLRTLVDSQAALTQPDLQAVGDLSVAVSVDVPLVAVGGAASVTVTVTNDGPLPALPDVVAVVPAGLEVGALPAGCTATVAPTGERVVTCTDASPLAPGASRTVVVPVAGAAPGAVDVTGAVVNPGAESDVDDNVATTRVTVTGDGPDGAPDLTVGVTVTEPRVWVGGRPVNAVTTVGNDGDGTAQDVELAVEPPPGTIDPNAEAAAALAAGCPQCTSPLQPEAGIEVWTRIDAVGPAGEGVVTATVTSDGADPVVATAPLEVVQPWLQVVPAVARPGEVVLAYGEDFPPGAEIHLTWSSGITTAPGPYTVGPDGRVSIPVLVVRNDVRGERWLRVTSGPATDLRGVLDQGFPRVVPTPPGAGGVPAAAAASTAVAPPCLDDPALAPTPAELSAELRDVTPTGPRWCELDAPLLVVTPSVGIPDVLERR